jgi:hypothetical protein
VKQANLTNKRSSRFGGRVDHDEIGKVEGGKVEGGKVEGGKVDDGKVDDGER